MMVRGCGGESLPPDSCNWLVDERGIAAMPDAALLEMVYGMWRSLADAASADLFLTGGILILAAVAAISAFIGRRSGETVSAEAGCRCHGSRGVRVRPSGGRDPLQELRLLYERGRISFPEYEAALASLSGFCGRGEDCRARRASESRIDA